MRTLFLILNALIGRTTRWWERAVVGMSISIVSWRLLSLMVFLMRVRITAMSGRYIIRIIFIRALPHLWALGVFLRILFSVVRVLLLF